MLQAWLVKYLGEIYSNLFAVLIMVAFIAWLVSTVVSNDKLHMGRQTETEKLLKCMQEVRP